MKTLALLLLLTACGHDESAKETLGQTAPTSAPAIAPEKGDAGPTGPQGSAGPKGDKGDKGDAGKAGANGKDGEMVTGNEWFDPITKIEWLISGEHAWQADICGASEWTLPTLATLQTAINHGMFVASHALAGPSTAWTIEPDSGGHIAIGVTVTGATGDSIKNGIFCQKVTQ